MGDVGSQRTIDFTDHTCLVCGTYRCVSLRSLGSHLAHSHRPMTTQQYTLQHVHGGIVPLCACGCGTAVAWHGTMSRYNAYVHGHGHGFTPSRQPAASFDVIRARNDAIRRSFTRRRSVTCAKQRDVVSASDIHDARCAASCHNGTDHGTIDRDVIIAGMRDALNAIEQVTRDPVDRALLDTLRLCDDRHAIIARTTLARMLRDGRRDEIEERLLPAVRTFFRGHVALHGWFYPGSDETLIGAIAALRRRDADLTQRSFSSLSSLGGSFLRSTFRSYWDVDKGPSQSFDDPRRLDGVLRYRLGLNNSKPYTYVMPEGGTITCNEVFDINVKNIRFGFIVQRCAVSWFKPSAAFDIYRKFLGSIVAPTVWDPSCGFGARMLGFAAAYPQGTYVGTDPASRTFDDLMTLRRMLIDALPGFSCYISCIGSERYVPNDVTFDLVFTSPPYFDREMYFDEPGQCWRDHPTSEAWRVRYLIPTLVTARDALRGGGRIVLNVNVACRDAVICAAQDAGLRVIDEMELKIGRDHFAKRHGHVEKGHAEPVLVLAMP